MGFVNSANILCAALPFEREEIKKAQHLWRCSPLNVLTQGSSLRSPTLGYQKQNPDGVRQFANILCAAPPFERDEIKKAQHLRRCVPLNVLTQGSSLCSPTLGYQKQNPYGVRQSANILCADLPFEIAIKSGRRWGRLFCKHPLPALPSPWRGVGGEALMLRLYSKLGIFLWFSLLFHIFHQT